jgi:hypothetical protein
MKASMHMRTIWLDVDRDTTWTEGFVELKREISLEPAKASGHGVLLADPSWDTVRAFLVRMDGKHFSTAELTVIDVGALLIGGGDNGRYAVLYYGESPELQRNSLTLTDYELSGPKVAITINRDATVIEARYAIRQPLMLEVAEEFYWFGVRKKGTQWEIGSSGRPYTEAD